jgi:hypothetical protein
MEMKMHIPHELILITHLATIDTLGHLMWKEKLWMNNPAAVLGIAQLCVPDIVMINRPTDWEFAFNSDRFRDRLYNFMNYLFDQWYTATDNMRPLLEELDFSAWHPLDQPSKQKLAKHVFTDYFIRHTAAYQKAKRDHQIIGYPSAPNQAFAHVLRLTINYHKTRTDTSILDQQ